MTMKRSGAYTAAVAAALMLAACRSSEGGNDRTTAATSESETEIATADDFASCGVMSAAEIEAITTDKVIKVDQGEAGVCYYRNNPGQELTLTVKKTGGTKAMEIVRYAATVTSGMGKSVADKGGAGKDVAELLKKDESATPKLGDDATWGMNSTLSVRKGDTFVEVTAPLMHDPATHPGYPLVKKEEKQKIAIEVATKVLARL